MEIFTLPAVRAVTSQIDRILDAFYTLFVNLVLSNGSLSIRKLINFIMSNDYLLISLSLLIIGFVIGIIKRLISV